MHRSSQTYSDQATVDNERSEYKRAHEEKIATLTDPLPPKLATALEDGELKVGGLEDLPDVETKAGKDDIAVGDCGDCIRSAQDA